MTSRLGMGGTLTAAVALVALGCTAEATPPDPVAVEAIDHAASRDVLLARHYHDLARENETLLRKGVATWTPADRKTYEANRALMDRIERGVYPAAFAPPARPELELARPGTATCAEERPPPSPPATAVPTVIVIRHEEPSAAPPTPPCAACAAALDADEVDEAAPETRPADPPTAAPLPTPPATAWPAVLPPVSLAKRCVTVANLSPYLIRVLVDGRSVGLDLPVEGRAPLCLEPGRRYVVSALAKVPAPGGAYGEPSGRAVVLHEDRPWPERVVFWIEDFAD